MMWRRRKMKPHSSPSFSFVCSVLAIFFTLSSAENCSENDGSLSAKELLKTISADYRTPRLPPGFPSLLEIQTNLFNFKTSDGFDRVSATLLNPVAMYPHY